MNCKFLKIVSQFKMLIKLTTETCFEKDLNHMKFTVVEPIFKLCYCRISSQAELTKQVRLSMVVKIIIS